MLIILNKLIVWNLVSINKVQKIFLCVPLFVIAPTLSPHRCRETAASRTAVRLILVVSIVRFIGMQTVLLSNPLPILFRNAPSQCIALLQTVLLSSYLTCPILFRIALNQVDEEIYFSSGYTLRREMELGLTWNKRGSELTNNDPNLTRRRVWIWKDTLIYHYPLCVLANLTRRRVKIRTETLIYHYIPCVLANLTKRRVKIRTESLIC